MNLKLIAPAVALLTAVGCSSFEPELVRRPLEVDTAVIHIVTDPKFSSMRDNGEAKWHEVDGVRHCTIYLKDYPWKLGHETDHCFRGKWHDGRPNSDDRG